MSIGTEWIPLVFLLLAFAFRLLLDRELKRVLSAASESGLLEAEARNVLNEGFRAQVSWVKENRARLPNEVRLIAERVAVFDSSMWVSAWLGLAACLLDLLLFLAPPS